MSKHTYTSRGKHIFPLPFFTLPHRPTSHSRRIKVRYKHTLAILLCANLCIHALNSLFLSPSMFSKPDRQTYSFSSTATQKRLCDSVFNFCREYIRTVSRVSIPTTTNCQSGSHSNLMCYIYTHIHSILFERTHTTNIPPSPVPTTSPIQHDMHHMHNSTDIDEDTYNIPYMSNIGDSNEVPLFYSQRLPTVRIIADKVSLPTTLNKVDMLQVLPKHIQDIYTTPVHVCPYPDIFGPVINTHIHRKPHKPRVGANESEYIKLLIRMTEIGMIDYTSNPRCINGIFGVPKSDGSIRLIIDATPANTRFIQPPNINLPTPTHIAQLVQNNKGMPLYISKTDLSNFYHCIALPRWLQPFFALRRIHISQLPIHIQARIREQHIHIHDGYIYPMCLTLPMGWSHSVYIAQHIHENILYSVDALRRQDNILHINSPYISNHCIRHWLYIDDAGLISTDYSLAYNTHIRIQQAYTQAGFQVNMNKVTNPTIEKIDVLGMQITGADGSIQVSPQIMLTLIRDTLVLIKRGVATGFELSRIVSKWTWSLLTRRPTLSILQHVYRYILLAQWDTFILWPSVKRELLMLICIAPLLSASLFQDFDNTVLAVDASSSGGAVVHSTVENINNINPNHFSDLWQCGYLSNHDIDMTEEGNLRYTLHSIPVDKSTYTTVSAYRWKHTGSHINELELSTMVTAIKWCISRPSKLGKKILLLTDSQVCYHAARKGRSSSPRLLFLLRKLAALCLASGIVLHIVWIASADNPADQPSRLYS